VLVARAIGEDGLVAVGVSVVALVVAVVGAVAGLAFIVLYGLDAVSDNTEANLGVVSILSSLIAIPIGLIGWRWEKRRRPNPVLGKSATLLGAGTFAAWLAVFIWALGQDTP
jgi:drug/metabolite transporter (DMT)-like permease